MGCYDPQKKHCAEPGNVLVAEERVVDEVPEMILSTDVAQEDPGELLEVAEQMAAKENVVKNYLNYKKAKKVNSKALVKKIVEREGGKVSVASEPGTGSTFGFSWPKTTHPTESS